MIEERTGSHKGFVSRVSKALLDENSGPNQNEWCFVVSQGQTHQLISTQDRIQNSARISCEREIFHHSPICVFFHECHPNCMTTGVRRERRPHHRLCRHSRAMAGAERSDATGQRWGGLEGCWRGVDARREHPAAAAAQGGGRRRGRWGGGGGGAARTAQGLGGAPPIRSLSRHATV
jgi:hypothetical protein